MDRYVKDGNTYTVSVAATKGGAVAKVTVTNQQGQVVGEAQGVDATLLIHRNFNADGSPKSGDDPERPY